MSMIPFLGLFDKAADTIDKLVLDKDKALELKFKMMELKLEAASKLTMSKTVPWVDATVKVFAALNMFSRPIGAAVMTGFGMYCHLKGISIDAGLHAVFDGAFPAWGVSRHVHKSKKVDAINNTNVDWDDD